MRSIRFSFAGTIFAVAVIAVTLSVAGSALGQETVIRLFNNNDGYDPIAGMIIDASGNLYGSTFYGGTYGAGNIFKLAPKGGTWVETELYSFNDVGVDGFWPNARLAVDSEGNLYGTTFFGGAFGAGIVFELTPNPDGGWTYKTLHSFGQSGDGTYPHGGLTVGAKGELYGTAAGGGSGTDGIVYELIPNGHGRFAEKILHSFSGGADGANPYSSLVLVSDSLYGTTYSGGGSAACVDGCGTVFAVTPAGDGSWVESVVHSFNNVDGANPDGGLIRDSAGNLYGAASQGNSGNLGAIFELTPADGGWQELTLHTFNQAGDGVYPIAPLTFDASSNLFGASEEGGTNNTGAVYELTPTAGGDWGEKVVYSFANGVNTPNHPGPGIVFDKAGNLYGGTLSGGDPTCLGGCGAIFEVTP
jgi:uncharacterized repeat protein (TIGR03803 family)